MDHRSHDGKTALRIAAIEGHKEVVQYMISVGASVSYKDADGRSTIYVLALENKFEMIQMLLEQNADVESADLEGRSALHVAAWQGHYKVIEVLVRYKAVVDAVDNDRRTALQSASWQGHDRVMQYLIEKGAKVDHMCNQGATALCIASQEGHENVGRVLLHFGANPNHADQFGRTPMKVAMKSGHVNVCKLLEQNGAVVPSGSKSRTSSSTSSSASNDTKPSSHIHTNTPVSANATISCVASISSAAPAVLNGTHLHSSPSESPDSTFDRRKSVLSNNSSKSSSNLTNSTNQSSLSSAFSSGTQPRPTESECLTFTQQLQQCSMTRNRARPVSRILSPVSEPVSPVQSPLGSPLEVTGDTFPGTNSSRFSPASARNLKLCNPSPAKLANFKPDKTSATVNITMNPNADINEEAVWQMNPFHANNLKSSLVMIENRRKTPDQPSKTIMGQSALEMSKSPEMRRKRNGIVTNPNLHKSKGINSVSHLNKLSKIENCDNRTPISNGNGALPNGHVSAMGNGKTGNGPVRPNGLPLKKETPL